MVGAGKLEIVGYAVARHVASEAHGHRGPRGRYLAGRVQDHGSQSPADLDVVDLVDGPERAQEALIPQILERALRHAVERPLGRPRPAF